MKLNFAQNQFTEADGYYYSPAFLQSSDDSLIAVAVWLSTNGSCSMQASIDGVDWIDIENTTFNCSPAGLQSYTDCLYELIFRIKANQEPTKAQILL